MSDHAGTASNDIVHQLRAAAKASGWVECDEAADEIEALRGALRDALALLPPERWKLLLPRYADVRVSVLDPQDNGSDRAGGSP